MSRPAENTIERLAAERRTSPSIFMRMYAVLWWTGMATICLVMFLGAVTVFALTALFDRNRLLLHLFSGMWAQSFYVLNPFWSCRVEGREKLLWKEGAVMVSNHDSLADILVLFGLYSPYKWVSKASVFSVPLVGWNMRLNQYIPLRRGNKESVVEMMDACRSWLDRGVSVLMFPEGTRSPDGITRRFKDGAFSLAMDTGAPIIPIAIAGTHDALPKHGLIAPLRSHCRVRVLDPVDPADFDDLATLREHVRDLIVTEKASLTARLRAEGRG